MKGFGYLLKEGIRNVWSNRMMSLASIGVLISCLILTGAAVLVSMNVQELVDKVGDGNVTNVYLENEVSAERAKEIGQEIKEIKNVNTVKFYGREEAIKEFEEKLGDLFDDMQGDENPLPDAYHITMDDLAYYNNTVNEIQAIDGVDQISNRQALAKRITGLSNLVGWLSVFIIIALGVISLFIISNTIRMSMYSRRFEISIMKSVGATNSFVRVPFVVEGVVIGLVSSILSFVGLYFLYNLIMGAVQNIISIGKPIEFTEVSLVVFLSFLVAGVLIGTLSGIISISKYLKKEGNEILGW